MIKFAHLSAFLVCLSLCSHAPAEMIRDVEYAKPDGVSLTLDVNVPEGKGPFPIAILVHGGGFTNVTKEQNVTPLFAPLTDANFTWFTINYRGLMSNTYPVWVQDVEQSIRWVKAHGAEYKGDTNRIALIGESFGGYLVMLAVGRATDDTKVNAAVVFYGPFMDMAAVAKKNGHIPDQQMQAFGIHKFEGALKILHEASIPTYLRPGLPPVLLIHGTLDTHVPYAVSMEAQKEMRKAGMRCDLIPVVGAPHGMVNWDKFDQSYKTNLIEWLEITLGNGK